MNVTIRIKWVLTVLLMLILAACGPALIRSGEKSESQNAPTGLQTDSIFREDSPLEEEGYPPPQSTPVHSGLQIDGARITVGEGIPSEVVLTVQGHLPSSCSQVNFEIQPPDSSGKIQVTASAVGESPENCQKVRHPFLQTVSLGSYSQGAYEVWVNGTKAGSFDLTQRVAMNKKNLQRGRVYLQDVGIDMDTLRSVDIKIRVEGALPTPCHQFQADVQPPDEHNQIYLDLYSLVDPGQICIQVLVDFQQEISLGRLAPGNYRVFVNGEQALEFSVP